jgi:hypothetical protein
MTQELTPEEEREAREEARLQAECLFEVIKDKAYELCVDLDWYTDEVLEQINKAREDSE